MHDNAPIIIASAQQTLRQPNSEQSPVDAMEAVVKLAIADSGKTSLPQHIDSIATVRFIADAVEATAALMPRCPGNTIAQRLGIDAQCYQSSIGGNTPQQLVNTFADKLAKGEHSCTLITGTELIASLFDAFRNGGDISHWAQEDGGDVTMLNKEVKGSTDHEDAHGMFEPTSVYAMFESAIRHELGHGIDQHQQYMAEFCSAMNAVACKNPNTYKPKALSIGDISSTENRNRYIGFPYTKAMNAILSVDMSAAVILTTVAKARELGIDESQWIYVRGGADSSDTWFVTERETLHQSPAIKATANAALEQAGFQQQDLHKFDIYSCFPSAVQVACDAIGISPNDKREVTITGGLYNFGGPGNNYSLHAIAEMAQQLRSEEPRHGMVTANGYYLTKHSVGVYSNTAPSKPWQAADSNSLQQQLDALPKRPVAEQANGKATIVAYTVAFQKDDPVRGILIGELENGERFVANTETDNAVFTRLMTEDLIGTMGTVVHDSGFNIFRFE